MIQNPWDEEVALRGGEVIARVYKEGEDDNLENPTEKNYFPPTKENYFYYYSEPLSRSFKMKYHHSYKAPYHDFDIDSYYVDQEEFKVKPENEKYFTTEEGVMDLEKVFGAPVKMTRNRF